MRRDWAEEQVEPLRIAEMTSARSRSIVGPDAIVRASERGQDAGLWPLGMRTWEWAMAGFSFKRTYNK
ncbi:hypothetical protein [Dactylosporangium sp. CA-233914]|uniref:hypothetical protein n=1 Tax=Dactylosporangium sp. CA-233914 TaxID=3239934 RepID=UPI003D94A5B6